MKNHPKKKSAAAATTSTATQPAPKAFTQAEILRAAAKLIRDHEQRLVMEHRRACAEASARMDQAVLHATREVIAQSGLSSNQVRWHLGRDSIHIEIGVTLPRQHPAVQEAMQRIDALGKEPNLRDESEIVAALRQQETDARIQALISDPQFKRRVEGITSKLLPAPQPSTQARLRNGL